MGLSVNEIIMFLCGMVVFVYCFINLFVRGKTRIARFGEKARENGWVTKGTCCKTKIRAGNSDQPAGSNLHYRRYYVTYEYFVEGKRYVKKLVYLDRTGTQFYPHEITLYYNPGRPSKAYSEGEASIDTQRGRGCFLTILFTGCTMKLVLEILERLL